MSWRDFQFFVNLSRVSRSSLSAGAIKQIMKLFGESGRRGRRGRTRMPLSALRRLLFVPTPPVWRPYVHELVYEQRTRVARRSGRSDTSIGILGTMSSLMHFRSIAFMFYLCQENSGFFDQYKFYNNNFFFLGWQTCNLFYSNYNVIINTDSFYVHHSSKDSLIGLKIY